MLIKASVRPRGMKRGVTTKAIYKAMGYKGESGPDLRDVVGALELSARNGNQTLFLAALHKAVGGFYSSGKVVIYDDKGKKVCTYETHKERTKSHPTQEEA